MQTQQGIHPNLDPNGTKLNKQRRNSDVGPRMPANPHSKVIKTKRTKGEPANAQTLLETINKFREEFNLDTINYDNRLADYVNKLLIGESIDVTLPDETVIEAFHIIDDFDDESCSQIIRNWVNIPHFLDVLTSPGTIGYVKLNEEENEPKKVAFLMAYTFQFK